MTSSFVRSTQVVLRPAPPPSGRGPISPRVPTAFDIGPLRVGSLRSRRWVRRPMAGVAQPGESAHANKGRNAMASVVRAFDTSESARDEDVAYDAVMCWEWEGGALAPTQADFSVGQSVDESETVPRRGRH